MTDFYQVGGSLKPDGSSYCMRPADEDIYKALIRGEFCYVLNSRQMGKSSLWIQTQQRLTKQGIKCAYIDLTSIGRKISQDNWYRVLFYELVTSLNLSIDKSWWDQQENLPPVQRLTKFVEDIVYEETENNIVICFDEIDTVISLDFSSDDFFAWIRNCYNKRANAPIRKRKIYEGLTFCILGVADAHSLIRDNIHTPFDIGQPINLDGFIKGQAQPLIQGLIGKVPNPQEVLEEILEWTGGQPFLTQKICKLIFESRTGSNSPSAETEINIRDFIQSRIINNWELQDNPEHLKSIRNRLLHKKSVAQRMLKLYQRILHEGAIPYSSTPDQIQLRLTGLVRQEGQTLKVYNKIYRKVFDEIWVERELDKIPPYIEKYEKYEKSRQQSEKILLSGAKLKEGLLWSKGKSLSESERKFLDLSKKKERKQVRLKANAILESAFLNDHRGRLIDEIGKWTNNQLNLTKIICDLAVKDKNYLRERQEKQFIKQLIQKYIIENWQQNKAEDYLIEIQNQILKQDGHAKSRLETYKDILQGPVIANNKPETSALLKSELIVDKNSALEVANEIFKKVFNLEWVNQNLKKQGEAYKIAERILTSKFEENQRAILIDEILAWTNNQLDLTRIISNLVLQYEDCLKQGEEKKFIEQLIRKTIIENWQQNEAKDYLIKIQNQILKQDGHAKSRLLEIYKDILQGQVIANNKPETSALLKSKLVIKNEGYLEVANRIYSEIFNLQWVNQELEKMRVVDNQSKLWGKNSSLSVLVVILAICGAIPLILSLLLFKSNIPNICTERNLSISLEKNIEKLNDLKNNESNKFPSKCETQLKELKLIDKAIKLARNNYVANIPNEDDAFEILCKIPESSSNLNYAKFWVNRWRRDDYWKPEIDQALKDNPECKKLIIIYEEIG